MSSEYTNPLEAVFKLIFLKSIKPHDLWKNILALILVSVIQKGLLPKKKKVVYRCAELDSVRPGLVMLFCVLPPCTAMLRNILVL